MRGAVVAGGGWRRGYSANVPRQTRHCRGRGVRGRAPRHNAKANPTRAVRNSGGTSKAIATATAPLWSWTSLARTRHLHLFTERTPFRTERKGHSPDAMPCQCPSCGRQADVPRTGPPPLALATLAFSVSPQPPPERQAPPAHRCKWRRTPSSGREAGSHDLDRPCRSWLGP